MGENLSSFFLSFQRKFISSSIFKNKERGPVKNQGSRRRRVHEFSSFDFLLLLLREDFATSLFPGFRDDRKKSDEKTPKSKVTSFFARRLINGRRSFPGFKRALKNGVKNGRERKRKIGKDEENDFVTPPFPGFQNSIEKWQPYSSRCSILTCVVY